MENAMVYFISFLLILITTINLIISISTSLVLIKIFEIIKNQEERYQLEEEAKRQARGLIDVDTPQVPYNLRLR